MSAFEPEEACVVGALETREAEVVGVVVLERAQAPQDGARPLRRTIASELEDPLADALLSGALHQGDSVTAVASGGALVLEKSGAGVLPA